MPNAPKTPLKNVRMPDRLWDQLGEAASRAGTDRSELVRQLVSWYVREPGSRLPERPARRAATD